MYTRQIVLTLSFTFMIFQQSISDKFLRTQLAPIWSVASVVSHVYIKRTFLCESLTTHQTLKWPFFRMNPRMNFQLLSFDKTLAASTTQMIPFSCVCFFVITQTRCCDYPFSTNITNITWQWSLVSLHMSSVSRIRAIHNRTHLASKNFLDVVGIVTVAVFCKTLFTQINFSTMLTNVTFALMLYFFMGIQCLLTHVTLVTTLAFVQKVLCMDSSHVIY